MARAPVLVMKASPALIAWDSFLTAYNKICVKDELQSAWKIMTFKNIFNIDISFSSSSSGSLYWDVSTSSVLLAPHRPMRWSTRWFSIINPLDFMIHCPLETSWFHYSHITCPVILTIAFYYSGLLYTAKFLKQHLLLLVFPIRGRILLSPQSMMCVPPPSLQPVPCQKAAAHSSITRHDYNYSYYSVLYAGDLQHKSSSPSRPHHKTLYCLPPQ